MIETYLNIVTHPFFWMILIMIACVNGILWITTLTPPKANIDKTWIRRNYVTIILSAACLLAISALTLYLVEIGISVSGLVDRLGKSVKDPKTEANDLRSLATAVALLMGVLAAAATIFFSVIRVWINERTASATEQALFNDKINAAFTDLHAQRQITKWKLEGHPTGWEDDVTRRNGAIDRLQGLASEEPEAAPRIARMLSVYVKELTREFPAETPPASTDPEELRVWANKLSVVRSDMQNAVQVLGRLRKASSADLNDGEINLIGANLQGFDLSHLNFEKVSFKGAELQGADLTYAELQGADLSGAELQGAYLRLAELQGAYLRGAKLQGADLSGAKLQGAYLSGAKLQGAYLSGAELQGADLSDAELQGADLSDAELQGAYLPGAKFDHATMLRGALTKCAALSGVDLEKTTITSKQLNAMFGDASVTLPDGKGPDDPEWPEHWSKEQLHWREFDNQWRAFQRERGFDPDNPV